MPACPRQQRCPVLRYGISRSGGSRARLIEVVILRGYKEHFDPFRQGLKIRIADQNRFHDFRSV